MKIVSLNICAAYAFDGLIAFLEREAATTDVFCFQEITSAADPIAPVTGNGWRPNALQEIGDRLPGFRPYFAPVQENPDWIPAHPGRAFFGTAIFVKSGVSVAEQGDFFICNGHNSYVNGDFETLGYNAIYVTVPHGASTLTICTVHGISLPGDKLDTPARLAQSEKLLAFLRVRPGETIVMGDFNLLPDTESIRMIERAGLRNLIRDYGITTTRGALVKKLHPEYALTPLGFQEFADYAFVSPGVTVKAFAVPDVPASDHLPLLLTIAD